MDDNSGVRVPLVDEAEATGKVAELYERAKKVTSLDFVPDMFRLVSSRPELLETMLAGYDGVFNHGNLPRQTRELISAWTSKVNQCPYCVGTHNFFLQVFGGSEELAHAIEVASSPDDLPVDEGMPGSAAPADQAQPNRVQDHGWDWEKAPDAGWSADDLLEAFFCAALFNFITRLVDGLGLGTTVTRSRISQQEVPDGPGRPGRRPRIEQGADMTPSRAVLITGCLLAQRPLLRYRLAPALRLHRQGWPVYATGRSLEGLKDLEQEGITPCWSDVSDEESMAAAVERITAEHGAVGVLINNAAYSLNGTIEQTPMDEVRRQFETNVFGLSRMTQLVLPGMRAQGAGRIVIMSSIFGLFATPGRGYYEATKHALEAIGDSLRLEVRRFGIKVVAHRTLAHPRRFRPDHRGRPRVLRDRQRPLRRLLASGSSPGTAPTGRWSAPRGVAVCRCARATSPPSSRRRSPCPAPDPLPPRHPGAASSAPAGDLRRTRLGQVRPHLLSDAVKGRPAPVRGRAPCVRDLLGKTREGAGLRRKDTGGTVKWPVIILPSVKNKGVARCAKSPDRRCRAGRAANSRSGCNSTIMTSP